MLLVLLAFNVALIVDGETEIESIELKNGMTLYAEKTVGYVQAKQRMEGK